jgi:hypothetical protein
MHTTFLARTVLYGKKKRRSEDAVQNEAKMQQSGRLHVARRGKKKLLQQGKQLLNSFVLVQVSVWEARKFLCFSFSLSSHRHFFIPLIFGSRFIDS